jgi:hypothetical protein
MKKNDGDEELNKEEEKWGFGGRIKNCFVPFGVKVWS